MDLNRVAANIMNPHATASDRAIEAYLTQRDTSAQVGARHHVVPRFYLQRFALNDQVAVRDTQDEQWRISSTRDLAIRNFYTFHHVDGYLDDSFEHMLSQIEGAAHRLLNERLNAFAKQRHFTPEEREVIDCFVAFQMVRGPEQRRIVELTADAYGKLLSEGRVPRDELEETEFVPHQNEHLRTLGIRSSRLKEELARRPTSIVTTAKPGFITCDEPVLLVGKGMVGGRRGRLVGVRGLANAPGVILPLDPRTLLMYGPPGSDFLPHERVEGHETDELVEDVEQIVAHKAYRWIIAHPSNTRARQLRVPGSRPVLTVTDGWGTELIPGLQATRRSLRSKYPLDPVKE